MTSTTIIPTSPPHHELFSYRGDGADVGVGGSVTGIRIGSWEISTTTAPIFSTPELEDAADDIRCPFPDMLFGHNRLELRHVPSALRVVLDPLEALKMVAVQGSGMDDGGEAWVKVSYSDKWIEKNRASQDKMSIVKPYDWTFTSSYSGTLLSDREFLKTDRHRIDLDRLKLPEPILFHSHVILYEDELADNGTAVLTARVRVMPSCFLILQRFFLRVDEVLFRIIDTRYYHEFGSNFLVRECLDKTEDYSVIRSKIPKQPPWSPTRSTEDLSLLTDSNWVAGVMLMHEPLDETETSNATADGKNRNVFTREYITIEP